MRECARRRLVVSRDVPKNLVIYLVRLPPVHDSVVVEKHGVPLLQANALNHGRVPAIDDVGYTAQVLGVWQPPTKRFNCIWRSPIFIHFAIAYSQQCHVHSVGDTGEKRRGDNWRGSHQTRIGAMTR